jgi:hypothetical protein
MTLGRFDRCLRAIVTPSGILGEFCGDAVRMSRAAKEFGMMDYRSNYYRDYYVTVLTRDRRCQR